ncbi:MAG: beta-glucosidase [Halieaceae bacterium]|jgi:beta-glucosidase
MFVKILKIGGLLVLLLLLVGGWYFYTQIYNYERIPLKADAALFPGVKTASDVDQLAKNLLEQMTLDEKIEQLYGEENSSLLKLAVNLFVLKRFPHMYIAGNERLGIPPFVLSDGPRGARVADVYGGATVFPVAMSRGASWDVGLEARVNDVIAMEIRAIGANMAATPCINILRHPGWGRAQETYGEDPWHVGQFGVAATHAVQMHNVMASPKHYVLNSIENSRFVVNVDVDERTLREVYLPQFKKVVQEGESATLMSAYNMARGEYVSNNKYLLTDVLRNDWGFEGFVHSDWFFAVYDAVPSIKAGLNIEMPLSKVYTKKVIKAALNAGELVQDDLDRLILQSLKTRLKYALAEDSMDYDVSLLATREHIDLAREAAEKGMVLLKNDNVLPFSREGAKEIAVIGRLADVENTGDHGSSNAKSPYVISPHRGLASYHAALGNSVVLDDASDLERSRKIAREADQVVVVVGYTYEDEGEYLISTENMKESAEAGRLIGEKGTGGDREDLSLVAADRELIEALAGTNDNLVVVYVGGSGIDMSDWDDKVPAILFAWYAGMEGGSALARVLYGDVNPSGKLPFAMPQDSEDYPYFTPYTDNITYGYYHGYTLFDKNDVEVAYPFGFGMSYTSYSYDNLRVLTPEMNSGDTLRVQVNVTNSGEMAGEEVAQMYVGFANSAVERPVKILRDFDKVALQPGETKTVTLDVAVSELAWYNPTDSEWQTESMSYEVYVGGSSAPKDLMTGMFRVR